MDNGLSRKQRDLRAALICAQFLGLMPFIGKRRFARGNLAGLRKEAHAAMMALATDRTLQHP